MCPLLKRSRNTVEVFNLQMQYNLLQVKGGLYVFFFGNMNIYTYFV